MPVLNRAIPRLLAEYYEDNIHEILKIIQKMS